MRSFEKISFEQFKCDISDDINLYNEYYLPSRSTKNSAGYDFKAVSDFVIPTGSSMKVPTGVKASMEVDEVLLIFVRSSMGVKHSISLMNTVGVIDSDYYNNSSNEGHVFLVLKNDGPKDYAVKKGDGIGQGIFIKYLTVINEEKIENDRVGVFGSTNGR